LSDGSARSGMGRWEPAPPFSSSRVDRSGRTAHEHLRTKARRGLVVGGRVYGHDNVEIKDGDRRVRVEYKINEEEAEIVRELFRRYAAGDGLRTIAKDLNARRIAPPRAGRRGTGSWSYSSIHEMVRRERYRGGVVWGKREKTYKGGTKVRVERRPEDWVRREVPAMRIVNEELWSAVQTRAVEQARAMGTQARGPRARYLLSGIGRCGECGGLRRRPGRCGRRSRGSARRSCRRPRRR
jgi:site-specific DNA recombinase